MTAPSLPPTAASAVARGLRTRSDGRRQPSRSFAAQSVRRQRVSPPGAGASAAPSAFPFSVSNASPSSFQPPPLATPVPGLGPRPPGVVLHGGPPESARPALPFLPPPRLASSPNSLLAVSPSIARPVNSVSPSVPRPGSVSRLPSSFGPSTSSPANPFPPGEPRSAAAAVASSPFLAPLLHAEAGPRRGSQGPFPAVASRAKPSAGPQASGLPAFPSAPFTLGSATAWPPSKSAADSRRRLGPELTSATFTFEESLFFTLLQLVESVAAPSPTSDKARRRDSGPQASSDRVRRPGESPPDAAQATDALGLLRTKRTLLLQLYAIIYGQPQSSRSSSAASLSSVFVRPSSAQASQLARGPLSPATLASILPDFRRLPSSGKTQKHLIALTERYKHVKDLGQELRRDNSLTPRVWLSLFYTLQGMGPKDSYEPLFMFFLRSLLPSFPHVFDAPSVSASSGVERPDRGGAAENAAAYKAEEDKAIDKTAVDFDPLFFRIDPESFLPLVDALARARLPYASLFCLQGALSLWGTRLVKNEADMQLALRILRGIALSVADQIKIPAQASSRPGKLCSSSTLSSAVAVSPPESSFTAPSLTSPASPPSASSTSASSSGASAPVSSTSRSPRTIDEPLTEEGFARASYAVVAAWQELWLIYQRLPDVHPSRKISFFLQALPWAAAMQRTCDEVYANMPTDVGNLAALAYSARMRQTYLFRLLQELQEAEKRGESPVHTGDLSRAVVSAANTSSNEGVASLSPSVYPAALYVSLPSLGKAQSSPLSTASQSVPCDSPGVVLSPVKAQPSPWQARVLGAAPLLSPHGLGDEREGDWARVAKGLWEGKGLFGDGVEFLQASHELLSDWSFLWAMPGEAEPVWLKLAAFASLVRVGVCPRPPSTKETLDARQEQSWGPKEEGELSCSNKLPKAESNRGDRPALLRSWKARMQTELEAGLAKRAGLSTCHGGSQGKPAGPLSASASPSGGQVETEGELKKVEEDPDSAEWLSLPRALVALEHLYCRAAHEFCRAPQHAIDQFVRTRPRDFIMLMLVSSFPSPSRRVHTPLPAVLSASTSASSKLSLSSLLLSPSSVSTPQRLASSCFLPCRHPVAPPLFFQFQNLIPRLPPFRQDERDDRGVHVAALTLLAVRWRWVCTWASDGSTSAAGGLNRVLPLSRFEHFMKAVSVLYSEALYTARLLLPHQQERYLLLQQLLRHLGYTPHNRIGIHQLATQGGPRAAANVVCMLAATREMHAATGLRHTLFEVLSSLLSNLFCKGIFFWPSRSPGPPFVPYPLDACSHAPATKPLLHLPSTSSASASPSCSPRPERGVELVFAPSPVTLLPYLHLVALDTSQARSVNPRVSYLRRTIRLYQVLFEACLRTPGAEGMGPQQLISQFATSQAGASSRRGGSEVASFKTPDYGREHSPNTPLASPCSPLPSSPTPSPSRPSAETKEATTSSALSGEQREHSRLVKSAAHREDSNKKRETEAEVTLYGLTEASVHRSWAVPLALNANVECAFHLPLLLPHLLNIWKEKLDARRYSALRSLLFRSTPQQAEAAVKTEGETRQTRGNATHVERNVEDATAGTEAREETTRESASGSPGSKPVSPELAVSTLVLFLCRAARIPLPTSLMKQEGRPAGQQPHGQTTETERTTTGTPARGDDEQAGAEAKEVRGTRLKDGEQEIKVAGESSGEGSGGKNGLWVTNTEQQEEVLIVNGTGQTGDAAQAAKKGMEDSEFVLDDEAADLALSSLRFDDDGNLVIPAEEKSEGVAKPTEQEQHETAETTMEGDTRAQDSLHSQQEILSASSHGLQRAEETEGMQEYEAEPGTTLDSSRFAEPLRHLTLTTLATGMTVVDEELQCVNEVIHRLSAKFGSSISAPATAETIDKDPFLSACFHPFPSITAYQAALSSLYDVFDLLFVEKLSSASVPELQLLALNTRRVIKLPHYLPFPSREDDRNVSGATGASGLPGGEEITSGFATTRGEAVGVSDGGGEIEEADGAKETQREPEDDEEEEGERGVRKATKKSEAERVHSGRWEEAMKDRREFFYGSLMQALVLRLTKLNSTLRRPELGHASGGEDSVATGGEVAMRTQGERPGDNQVLMKSRAEAVSLFELLLHMLAGSPLPVQRELLFLLLQRSDANTEHEHLEEGRTGVQEAASFDDVTFSHIGGSAPETGEESSGFSDEMKERQNLLLHLSKPFELLCDAVPSMSECQLYRFVLAVARLDLLGCLFPTAEEKRRSALGYPAVPMAASALASPVFCAAPVAAERQRRLGPLCPPGAPSEQSGDGEESPYTNDVRSRGSAPALTAPPVKLHLLLSLDMEGKEGIGDAVESAVQGADRGSRGLREETRRETSGRKQEAERTVQQSKRREERRLAAMHLQRAVEGALRSKLACGWATLSFSEATGLLWALTVMPEPKMDLLVLLFDRIESFFNVVLEEQRIIEQPADLPNHIPFLTSGPIYRFLATHTPVDSTRLRTACVSLLHEGDASVVSSLQARFPLCWVALEVLSSTRFHQERSIFSDTFATSHSGRTPDEGEHGSDSEDEIDGQGRKTTQCATSAVSPLAQSVIRMTQMKHGLSLLWATDFEIPGLPFHFDLALPKQRIVFLLGSHCASMPLTDDTDTFDPLSCISGLEPDLVSAVPTLPLVVQRRETNADGITGGKGDASGKTRDFNWELSECVVGSPRSGMNEIGEQKQKFRDAGSCGGRRLIRRLTEKAGYRLIEVEAPDAAQLDAALTRILQVGDHLS
ncbi:hypothetical protein TGDOM2_292975 [Toxoplasma gondii GAB2-2007-GAL-DOM2]|uniref:Uncharacterized protein n=2 Tax=Toxoplasma gondii TaxID=5811 RepID=A0A086KSA5_TOXGO|nr:hypothetical protein TGDOM2_292975 [Toxoplasma gondii GAB2-2007-GAL-DOM2]KFG47273.1 hypothetical protein TGFOU_292975 [Toxoplasma gondii FOU]